MPHEQENPTAESGASTLERLERYLTPQEEIKDEKPVEATETQEETETQTEQSDDTAPADEPEQAVETPEYQLSDIAKLLGADESSLDVDDDGNVIVKTKVDGQEGKAKFADLLKSYQLQSHVDKQVREAAEQRKALQEQSQAIEQQMRVQHAIVDKIAEVKAIETEIERYSGIDWNGLIDADPSQAQKLDFQLRQLHKLLSDKRGDVETARSQIQQHQAQLQNATLTEERQALLNALPDWTDETKASKEKKAIAEDLKARGFTDQYIDTLSDHKAVLLARDAMLYRQQKAANTVTEKQVRAAPKIAKPGQSAQKTQTSVQSLKNAVIKSGSKQSVVDYLLGTGKV